MHTHNRAASGWSRTVGAFAIAATLGLASAALLQPASPAHAHDQLIDAAIEASSNGEASALRLTFSDNVLEVGTEIHVTDPDGGDATSAAPVFNGRDVTQALKTPLPDGSYMSAWRVVSSDGHPIEGAFSFDVAAGEASEVRPYVPESDAGDSAVAGDADTSEGATLALPLAIGGAALVAVAIAIPLFMRMRRSAQPGEGTSLPDTQE